MEEKEKMKGKGGREDVEIGKVEQRGEELRRERNEGEKGGGKGRTEEEKGKKK